MYTVRNFHTRWNKWFVRLETDRQTGRQAGGQADRETSKERKNVNRDKTIGRREKWDLYLIWRLWWPLAWNPLPLHWSWRRSRGRTPPTGADQPWGRRPQNWVGYSWTRAADCCSAAVCLTSLTSPHCPENPSRSDDRSGDPVPGILHETVCHLHVNIPNKRLPCSTIVKRKRTNFSLHERSVQTFYYFVPEYIKRKLFTLSSLS